MLRIVLFLGDEPLRSKSIVSAPALGPPAPPPIPQNEPNLPLPKPAPVLQPIQGPSPLDPASPISTSPPVPASAPSPAVPAALTPIFYPDIKTKSKPRKPVAQPRHTLDNRLTRAYETFARLESQKTTGMVYIAPPNVNMLVEMSRLALVALQNRKQTVMVTFEGSNQEAIFNQEKELFGFQSLASSPWFVNLYGSSETKEFIDKAHAPRHALILFAKAEDDSFQDQTYTAFYKKLVQNGALPVLGVNDYRLAEKQQIEKFIRCFDTKEFKATMDTSVLRFASHRFAQEPLPQLPSFVDISDLEKDDAKLWYDQTKSVFSIVQPTGSPAEMKNMIKTKLSLLLPKEDKTNRVLVVSFAAGTTRGVISTTVNRIRGDKKNPVISQDGWQKEKLDLTTRRKSQRSALIIINETKSEMAAFLEDLFYWYQLGRVFIWCENKTANAMATEMKKKYEEFLDSFVPQTEKATVEVKGRDVVSTRDLDLDEQQNQDLEKSVEEEKQLYAEYNAEITRQAEQWAERELEANAEANAEMARQAEEWEKEQKKKEEEEEEDDEEGDEEGDEETDEEEDEEENEEEETPITAEEKKQVMQPPIQMRLRETRIDEAIYRLNKVDNNGLVYLCPPGLNTCIEMSCLAIGYAREHAHFKFIFASAEGSDTKQIYENVTTKPSWKPPAEVNIAHVSGIYKGTFKRHKFLKAIKEQIDSHGKKPIILIVPYTENMYKTYDEIRNMAQGHMKIVFAVNNFYLFDQFNILRLAECLSATNKGKSLEQIWKDVLFFPETRYQPKTLKPTLEVFSTSGDSKESDLIKQWNNVAETSLCIFSQASVDAMAELMETITAPLDIVTISDSEKSYQTVSATLTRLQKSRKGAVDWKLKTYHDWSAEKRDLTVRMVQDRQLIILHLDKTTDPFAIADLLYWYQMSSVALICATDKDRDLANIIALRLEKFEGLITGNMSTDQVLKNPRSGLR